MMKGCLPPPGPAVTPTAAPVTPRRIRLALVVYGVLVALALLWGVLRGDVNLYHHPEPWLGLVFPASTLAAIGAGLAVAVAVVVSTRVLVRRTRWARLLHVEFRELLGPLSAGEIAVFALTSGIAEEMLFRGAMQPSLGIVWASIIFGAMHVGPMKRLWVWTVWATAMGFVFGALYAATGELLAPVVAHVVINYENMHFIESYDPGAGGPRPTRRTPSDSIVGNRLRAGK